MIQTKAVPDLHKISDEIIKNKRKEKLAKKIKSGGSGVWGEDIMPPQPHVSNEDAIALAKYILSLK